jgi:phosphatidylethanolamine/phosphatidyl-N-methylethanolamine N-methyltransferase
LARLYDPVFGLVFEPRHRLAIRLLDLKSGTRILDVGVGTGLSLSQYPTCTYVIGVDLSEAMLRVASRKVRERGHRHVALSRMDACRLGFPTGSFDVVLSAFVASVVPDRRAFFEELKRVCRPGGSICIINHVHFRTQPLAWLEERLGPLTRRFGWHADLNLNEIVESVGPGEVAVHNLWPSEPWPVVICRRPI